MHKGTQIKKRFIICLMTVLMAAVLSGCGESAGKETEEKVFGIDFMQELLVQEPEYAVCGQESVWVMTARKNDFIYRLDQGTGTVDITEVEWQQEEGENLINVAEHDGTLYAEIQHVEEDIFEIRKQYIDNMWKTVMTIRAENEGWYDLGSGLFVDGDEKVYLVSGDIVTCFGEGGERICEYKLSGNVCFFEENDEGYVECVTLGTDKIALYELKAPAAEEKWTLEVSARQAYGIRSSEEGTLCMASNEEILFVDRNSGNLLASVDLAMLGVSSVQAGYYDAEGETLQLYGTASGEGNLFCSLLSGRDASAEQRTEIVYGTVGKANKEAPASIKEAILQFNQENENYYVTIRNYYSEDYGEEFLQRLHADLASGNGPDIIDLSNSEYYESYVKNGYLENLSPYLEQSEYRDDIMWNVLSTYEVNGGLYLLTPQFRLYGVLLNPEYEADTKEWDMETFFELIEKNQWEKDILGTAGGDPATLLNWMMYGMLEDFVDWDQKTASFETEEFIDLLTLCKEYGEQDWSYLSELTYEEQQRNMLCSVAVYGMFKSYLSNVEAYGREYPIHGYPASSGQSYGIYVCTDCCGIYTGSKNKEGAWEFVESLLGDSHQKYTNDFNPGFPIRGSVLKELENEEEVLNINGSELTMTENEFLILEDIFYNGNLARYGIDPDIWNVVSEESASYFSGDKSAEAVAQIIQNRVGLILNE